MKKLISTISIIVMFTFICSGQNDEGFLNYEWFQAKYVKFKPGMVSEARELLKRYLYKANEISGRLVLTFESDTGEWDHIAYLYLINGPKQLDDKNSEIEVKWWNGVVELTGSEEKAKEVIKKYQNCILKENYNLVRMRNMDDQMSRKP